MSKLFPHSTVLAAIKYGSVVLDKGLIMMSRKHGAPVELEPARFQTLIDDGKVAVVDGKPSLTEGGAEFLSALQDGQWCHDQGINYLASLDDNCLEKFLQDSGFSFQMSWKEKGLDGIQVDGRNLPPTKAIVERYTRTSWQNHVTALAAIKTFKDSVTNQPRTKVLLNTRGNSLRAFLVGAAATAWGDMQKHEREDSMIALMDWAEQQNSSDRDEACASAPVEGKWRVQP